MPVGDLILEDVACDLEDKAVAVMLWPEELRQKGLEETFYHQISNREHEAAAYRIAAAIVRSRKEF